MKRFTLIIVSMIVMSATTTADDTAKALALLKGVEQERLKYDCFHIRYEEHRAEEGKTVEQLVDFDKGKIRKMHLPDGSFTGMKSILLEDYMYTTTSYDAKTATIVPLGSIHAVGADVYDPRLLGLADMLSHDYDIAICLLYGNRSNFSVSRGELDGRPVYIVECRDGEGNSFAPTHWRLYIEEPGFRLLRRTVETQFSRIQIDNDYSNQKFLPFPTKTHVYRVRTDGEVVFDRHITVKDVQIKKSFPPDTFTLAGLDLPLNADVLDYRISRRVGYWDGEKLVDNPVRISALESQESPSPRKAGQGRYIGFAMVILLGLYFAIGGAMVLLLYLYVRKQRNNG